MSRKKKQTIGKINQLDLILNSPDKLNRSMEIVRQGTGTHKDKTKYNRKLMKRQWENDGYYCGSKNWLRIIPIISLYLSEL